MSMRIRFWLKAPPLLPYICRRCVSGIKQSHSYNYRLDCPMSCFLTGCKCGQRMLLTCERLQPANVALTERMRHHQHPDLWATNPAPTESCSCKKHMHRQYTESPCRQVILTNGGAGCKQKYIHQVRNDEYHIFGGSTVRHFATNELVHNCPIVVSCFYSIEDEVQKGSRSQHFPAGAVGMVTVNGCGSHQDGCDLSHWLQAAQSEP